MCSHLYKQKPFHFTAQRKSVSLIIALGNFRPHRMTRESISWLGYRWIFSSPGNNCDMLYELLSVQRYIANAEPLSWNLMSTIIIIIHPERNLHLLILLHTLVQILGTNLQQKHIHARWIWSCEQISWNPSHVFIVKLFLPDNERRWVNGYRLTSCGRNWTRQGGKSVHTTIV